MRVLLISANRETMNMPTMPLGLLSVAAALRQAGHDLRLIDFLQTEQPLPTVAALITEFTPEVIGISIRNIDDQNRLAPSFLLEPVKELVAFCRKQSISPVVIGGAGYSIFPQQVLDYVKADWGIAGEGEASFPDLLQRLSCHRSLEGLPGLYTPQGTTLISPAISADLDAFTFPVPSAKAVDTVWAPIQTRRGCDRRCIYCSTPAIEGRRVRGRSIGSVLNQLRRWRELGYRRFYLVDSTFNIPYAYALELVNAIVAADLDVTLRCIVYPQGLTKELAASLAAAGCTEASVGFETGAAAMLRRLGKDFSLDDIRTTCINLAEAGISVTGFLLLGGPGETLESVDNSLQFCDHLPLTLLKLTVGIRIYPATPLETIARQKGILLPQQSLLYPTFYLEPGLEPWIYHTLAEWRRSRPHWIC